MLIATISLITILPMDAEAEKCPSRVIPDESYIILSSTSDSVTANFSLDDLGCELGDGVVLHNGLRISDGSSTQDIPVAVNGATFFDLLPDTQYEITVFVWHEHPRHSKGFFNATIQTQPEPLPEPLPEPEPEPEPEQDPEPEPEPEPEPKPLPSLQHQSENDL